MRLAPRSAAAELEPYTPGKAGEDDDHSLASNEPSTSASRSVRAAVISAVDRLHRYPDPLASMVRTRLGEELDVNPEQILVGNGSDELIYLLCLAYLSPGGVVGCAEPPYRLHDLVPKLMGGTVTRVPMVNWRHDLQAMAALPCDFAFVCNPHNPTGTIVQAGALEEFAERARAGLIIVDEAYIDFADEPSRLTVLHLARRGQLIVIRTFSKLLGLAGARLGYLVGPREVVDMLRRIRPPFSVNVFAQAAAVAALGDFGQRHRSREHVVAHRPLVIRLFEEAGYRCIPSQANFICVLTDREDELVARLWERGISVRPGKTLGLPGSVRVTIPSRQGVELLKDVFRAGVRVWS
jgi:histidinol-phosphate aminotransferase